MVGKIKVTVNSSLTISCRITIAVNKDHSSLNNLDYEHSGHTGFASKEYVDSVKGTKLYVHTLHFRVNGDVNSQPRILSTRKEAFTSLLDIYNHRDTILSNSNIDTLFYTQFDLIYLYDLYTFQGTPAVRIFNIVNKDYTYSTNVVLVSDTVTGI
ncbi:MAG: hypothetical protein J6M95_04315 [Bacilli bacterium]|nr:hypothetical protein [Bacilli bacterium]